MVTITSLAKDERSARVALASALEPDDAVTGRLLAAVGAVGAAGAVTKTAAESLGDSPEIVWLPTG